MFVLGVYGHTARIYRFDRSGIIVSKAFSFISSSHILGDFFWRLVHPGNLSSCIAGSDTTITRPTEDEAERMLGLIQRYHQGLEIDAAALLQDSRWVVASCPRVMTHPGWKRCFTIGPALSQSTNLFLEPRSSGESLLKGMRGPKHSFTSVFRSTKEIRRGSG